MARAATPVDWSPPRAVERGLRPLVSGRSAQAVREGAAANGLEARPFDLSDRRTAARHLADVDIGLRCAGPFAATYAPMGRACLDSSTHHLDMSGEMDVVDGVYRHDEDARAAGIALFPGVGFDVVPTDHLLARLVDALPGASGADVAVISRGGFSRGTLQTAADGVSRGNRVRSHGALVEVPTPAVCGPWVSADRGRSGWHRPRWATFPLLTTGTGLVGIATFTVIPAPAAVRRSSPFVQHLMDSRPALVRRAIDLVPRPSVDTRGRTRSTGWVHVWNDAGEGLVHAVDVTNTYSFTARLMVHADITLA